MKLKLTGTSPLIMHSGQTSDPSNIFSKEIKKISGKRGKVEADFEAMSKIEFQAGLYKTGKEICVPSYVLDAAFLNGGKKFKLGNQFKSGVFVKEDAILEFPDKGKTDEELYPIYAFKIAVKVGQAKVIRTRPKFDTWSLTVEVDIDSEIIDKDDVFKSIQKAGEVVGIGDWRPRFGRFKVEII